jgi:hypothetical protein
MVGWIIPTVVAEDVKKTKQENSSGELSLSDVN